MLRLAIRSLRARRTAFAACALSIFLGGAMMLAFLSMLETAQADGVSSDDRETLVTIASVVGGWGVIIVIFSVASTLGITVRQRATELATLRTLGGTRRQIRRLVVRETMIVALLASLAAVLPGWALGRLVLAVLHRADLVADSVHHAIGVLSIGSTVVAMLVASGIAASLAARRATRGSAAAALAAASSGGAAGRTRMGKARIVFALLFLAVGLNYSILTVTVMADATDPYIAMSTAGPASIFWSLGLALLGPVLLRVAATLAEVVLARSRVAGYLATFNARQRSHQLAGALMPVIIFVGISTGTLYLVSIQNSLNLAPDSEGDTVELLNYVVTGMISLFAAIMVVNTLVAEVSDRRRELATQRLIGVERRQLIAMIGIEGALLAAVGIVAGALASLGTVIPYAIIKTDGVLPDSGPGIFYGVCVTAVAVTVTTSIVTAGRASRPVVREAIGRA